MNDEQIKTDPDIVERLRDRACPAYLPWTGDNEREDHGHTDCWLHHQAADEIERLRVLITEWVDAEEGYFDSSTEEGQRKVDRLDAAEDALQKAIKS